MFWQSSVFKLKNNFYNSNQTGFGLVELMVSISIMVIISSVVLSRHDSFNGAVLLRSQTYEVALDAREIQLNAVSAVSDGSGNFRSQQGVHFDTNSSNDGIYRIFRDADGDGFFDANESYGQQGSLDSRFEIRAINLVGSDALNGSSVSVVFQRPNFDALFYDSSGQLAGTSAVEIEVARRGSSGVTVADFRTLVITATGQITVR